jgi:hypothetical protein
MPFYCLNNISATLNFFTAGLWAANITLPAAGPLAANFTPPSAGSLASNFTPLDRWAANFTHLKF